MAWPHVLDSMSHTHTSNDYNGKAKLQNDLDKVLWRKEKVDKRGVHRYHCRKGSLQGLAKLVSAARQEGET